jgi:hypothetical protein
MKELALHILDITQNSVRAKATGIKIGIKESPVANTLIITIADNGCGMSAEVLKNAVDPFYTSRTTRRVGLGLPLFRMHADQAGGGMEITSEPGKGTTVTGTFAYDNIDRPPIGDIAGTIALIISGNPSIDFHFSYFFEDEEWSIDTHDLRDALGNTPVNDLKVVKYLKEMINENIEELKKINK